MEKNNIIRRKNEKGAITLFVLVACLFFMLTLSGVYISNLNKVQNQERHIKQIQENYARDLNRIEEIYESIAGQ